MSIIVFVIRNVFCYNKSKIKGALSVERFGISFDVRNKPVLDDSFMPVLLFDRAYSKGAAKDLVIALASREGRVAVRSLKIHGTPEMRQADCFYAERVVKAMLWMQGGYKVSISGDREVFEYVKAAYAPDGERAFDADFMSRVYESPFEVLYTDTPPEPQGASQAVGRHLAGCRVGFDAGGSDRKVSAVIDGDPVFSEEVVWHPKTNSDPDYHYQGILSAFKKAAEKMPRVDAVGVSSAGIYIDNRTMVASLFLQVPEKDFNEKVKDIYIRAARDAFGPDVPLTVCNDGDVTALAGAIGLGANNVLGIAMGTSQAVGFVDEKGNITGWLNELAFMPVDFQLNGSEDEWSGDIGCGVKYFSQDAIIKLAPRAGITLDESLTPAGKLKAIQSLMRDGDERALLVYETIGTYLGHSLAYYHELYGCKHVLLLGRVMSGRGGDLILEEAKRVLADEYPETKGRLLPSLPDEKTRRVGQSVAAASLPEVSE
jgi:predicted NBD/HSP70 family sugar kinase